MWGPNQEVAHPRHDGKTFYLPSTSAAGAAALGASLLPHSNLVCAPLNPHIPREPVDTATGDGDGTVRALLTRFRIENERLRDQVKAHVVQEALLTQRLQELSARNTALHLQDFRKRDNDAVVEKLKKQLEVKEMEVRALQLQVGELNGRISAYEEVISRPDHPQGLSANSMDRVRELICEALSSAGFLTRVANAVEHCHPSTHEVTDCPRSVEECTNHCLQAAMRGNKELPGETAARGHHVSCEELASALREEVLFCETVAVRVAAKLFMERSSADSSAKADRGTGLQHQEESAPPLARPTAECPPEAHELPQSDRRPRRKPAARPTVEDCEVQ